MKHSNVSHALEATFVTETFWSKDFIELCRKNIGKWEQVPAGKAATAEKLLVNPLDGIKSGGKNKGLKERWSPPLADGNPVVCYQQKNLNTCLFNAVSSVLMYYGDRDSAVLVNNLIAVGQKERNHLHFINSKLLSDYYIFPVDCNYDAANDQLTFTLIENKYYEEDIRNMARKGISFYPKVGAIEASDGCLNHAVGVFNNWIFDTTLLHAMELTKDNLDWCASTDTEKSSFVRFDACSMYVKKINHRNKCSTREPLA